MFGFSRGACTVRALLGLLRYHGLTEPGNEPLVPYAIRSLMAVNREARKSHAALQAALRRRLGQAQFRRLNQQPAEN
jgi:uncharacterized protein (DUF2235 family)